MKIHLHDEQFDFYLHAACGRYDSKVRGLRDPYILGEEDFEKVPSAKRCSRCTRINWPRGGAPL